MFLPHPSYRTAELTRSVLQCINNTAPSFCVSYTDHQLLRWWPAGLPGTISCMQPQRAYLQKTLSQFFLLKCSWKCEKFRWSRCFQPTEWAKVSFITRQPETMTIISADRNEKHAFVFFCLQSMTHSFKITHNDDENLKTPSGYINK